MAKLSGKDTVVKYNQILSDLKNKIYKPVYLLMGEETYYIDKLSDFIAGNVLPEAERSFNQTVIYGKDVDNISMIADAARRYPMMSNYQVMIIREAQDIRRIEELDAYMKNPLSTTIMVICYRGKVVDKRTSFYKTITKIGEVLESARLYENEVSGWISTYVKNQNREIEPSAAAILADYLGSDLSKVVNELDKLFVVIPENRVKITGADIEENIGISKDYNTFELSSAISKRDAKKAYRIAEYFSKNPKEHPLLLTVTTLFTQFSKILKYHSLKRQRAETREIVSALGINPFFLRDYESAARNFNLAQTVKVISLLREYDMKSKGFNSAIGDDGELLRELIAKIFN